MPNSPTVPRGISRLAGFALAATVLAGLLAAVCLPASALAETGTAAVAWGDNGTLELGAGYKNTAEEAPVSVVGLSNIADVQLGYHLSVARLGDGTVWTWGGNALGQLGNGTHHENGTPGNVGLHGVRSISVGGAHVFALLENGTLENWGDDEFGELGNGVLNPITKTNSRGQKETTMQGSGRDEPVLVPNVHNVVSVANAGGSAFALLSNGTVLAWGKNNRGQLGTGKIGPQVCKTEVGEVACNTKPEPVLLANREPLRGVKAIASGAEADYALLNNGTVMAWGNNGRGQLGDNSLEKSDVAVAVQDLNNVVAISAGQPFALALLADGRVAGWGGNHAGQLGVQANETCETFPCLKTPRIVPGLEHISSVSAGYGFMLALSHGKLWSLGRNEPWGQLGVGNLISTSAPQPVEGLPPVLTMDAGIEHAVAVLQSGTGPVPRFSVTPSEGSLSVAWTVSAQAAALRWRQAGSKFDEGEGPWSRMVAFRKECTVSVPCAYSITGLPPVPYEVELITYASSRIAMMRKSIVTP